MTEFADRHLGPRDAEVEVMLATVGVGSLDELVDKLDRQVWRHKTRLQDHHHEAPKRVM